MATNEFKPFSIAGGANIISQAEYEALAALSTGFSSGVAKANEINKVLRQSSFIAAALAQYTANKSGLDVLDNGDLNGFITKMATAFGKDFQTLDATLTALAGLATGENKLPYFTGADTAAQTDLTSVGRDVIGQTTVASLLTYLGVTQALNLKAPLDSPQLTGTPTAPTARQSEIDFRIANTAFVAQAISILNGGAPSSLNTLNKLAEAINNDANFYTTMSNAINQKAAQSDFASSKTSSTIVGNQSGGLRFMCGSVSAPTDSNGNVHITLPDTFLNRVVFSTAVQAKDDYSGDSQPFIFSSYPPLSGPVSSVAFAVRNTRTGAAWVNSAIDLTYFIRGY